MHKRIDRLVAYCYVRRLGFSLIALSANLEDGDLRCPPPRGYSRGTTACRPTELRG